MIGTDLILLNFIFLSRPFIKLFCIRKLSVVQGGSNKIELNFLGYQILTAFTLSYELLL